MTRAKAKKKSVRLPAFAKINLCLHVLGKRPDGYHELRTIFQAISLRDMLELSFTPGSDGFHFTLTSNDAALLGPENLVARAVIAMQREIGFQGNVNAHLEKKIPVARGMGGGSSDAAAAMIGMLRLTGAKVPLARLMEIAASLGADVPFFLFGGRALAVNRGDEIYPLPNAPKQTIVVVSPRDIGVSTKDAFQWISADLTKRPEPPKIWGFCALCWSRQGAGLRPSSAPGRNSGRIAQARSRRCRAGG